VAETFAELFLRGLEPREKKSVRRRAPDRPVEPVLRRGGAKP
jgi:hypothetical protein